MKNPWREPDFLLRWKVSFQTSYDDSKKLPRCRLKVLRRPIASSTLKPPSPELHNVESPYFFLSLSFNVLGERRNGDLRFRVFKIPQVKPILVSIRSAFDPSHEARNFAGFLNRCPISSCSKPLRVRSAVQVFDCHPYSCGMAH